MYKVYLLKLKKKAWLRIMAFFIIQFLLSTNLQIIYAREITREPTPINIDTLSPQLSMAKSSVEVFFRKSFPADKEWPIPLKSEQKFLFKTKNSLLKLTEALEEDVLWQIIAANDPEFISTFESLKSQHQVKNGFLTAMHARLYTSFKDMARKEILQQLKAAGARNIYLLGAFEKSDMSHKVNKFLKDDKIHPLFYTRNQQDVSKVVSILRSNSAKENTAHDYEASTFSIVDYEPDSQMGGWKGFQALLDEVNKQGMNIFVDLVAQGTAIDSPWLMNEELQTGDIYWDDINKIWQGYYYIHKTLPENVQNRLLALDRARALPSLDDEDKLWTDEQREFIQLCNDILISNPGHVLHYSSKLKQWILIVNSQDNDTKKNKKTPWEDMLQLDLSNPCVQEAIIEKVIKLVQAGVKGFRADCAMASVIHGKAGFLDTWHDYLGNKHVGEEFWHNLIERIKTVSGEVTFIAEAYWLFDKLEECGFDYIYQKHVGDSMIHRNIPGLRDYLRKTRIEEQFKRLHAVNNHDDEPPYIRDLNGTHFKRFPELTAKQFFRDLLNIAALPGIPQIQEEQLLWGYFARARARWNKLDQVDTHHNIIKNMAGITAEISRDSLLRNGQLYVLNNSGRAIFGFLRYYEGRRALVLTNYHQYQYFEEISIQEAASLISISKEPGYYYALVNRLNGEISIVSGRQLHNKILTINFSEQAETRLYMFEELQDDTGFIENLCLQNEPEWGGPSIYLNQLKWEDVFLLVDKFGLKIDYPCKGKISKAIALKHILDNFSQEQIHEALLKNNSFKIVDFAAEEDMITKQIEEFKQRFEDDGKVSILCKALDFLNQKGALSNKKLVLNENSGAKTRIKVKHDSIFITLGQPCIAYPKTREGQQKIRYYIEKIGRQVSSKGFRGWNVDDQIAGCCEAFLALFNDEIFEIIMKQANSLPTSLRVLEIVSQDRTRFAMTMFGWDNKDGIFLYDDETKPFYAQAMIDKFGKKLESLEWFDREYFAAFLAYYLINMDKTDTIKKILDRDFKEMSRRSYYELLFFQQFVDSLLFLKKEKVDTIFLDLLNTPFRDDKSLFYFQNLIILAMKHAQRIDLRVNGLPLERFIKLLGLAMKSRQITDLNDLVLTLPLIGSAI
ncbi:MAG: hypothetical protein L6416_05790 [Candidatus Omnitrophica bacterium]|nr:hypothetical protein [Candidatus Omnitrophota bacterium]